MRTVRSGVVLDPAVALHPAERRLRAALTTFGTLLIFGSLVYATGPLLDEIAGLLVWIPLVGEALSATLTAAAAAFRHLPFVANSVVKVTALGLLCLYAAGDIRRRGDLVMIVLGGHAVSVLAMLALILFGPVDGVVSTGDATIAVRTILWIGIGLDGFILAVLAFLFFPARRATAASRSATEGPASGDHAGAEPRYDGSTRPWIHVEDEDRPLTAAERRLAVLATVLGVLFLLGAAFYMAGPFLPEIRAAFIELPFVTNSVVRWWVLGFLCLYAPREARRRQSLLGIVIAAQALSVATLLLYWATHWNAGPGLDLGAWSLNGTLGLMLAVDGALGAVLFIAYQAAWRERYGLEFLQPIEFRTLHALADVLVVGDEERIPPLQVARNVDHFVSEIAARRRWVYGVVLFVLYIHPVLYRKAPLPELEAGVRIRHIKRHFYSDVNRRLLPDSLRQFVQAMIRIAKQLTYVGYYNDRKVWPSLGYRTFEERRIAAGQPVPAKSETTLRVMTDTYLDARIGGANRLETDICVIGSGAAGAVIAHSLSRRFPDREILIVERGKYMAPGDFNDDEVRMMGSLYADGLFQQTRDYRFTILQGSCVGGTTVVNNAVSFDPPAPIVERWNREYDTGLTPAALAPHIAAIRDLIRIQPQGQNLNPSGQRFVDAAARYAAGEEPPKDLEVDVVDANIEDCLGCGYCNIGCAYGRKLSMLDQVLPMAQQGARVEILPDCEITRLKTYSAGRSNGEPRFRVKTALAELADGRHITIEAGTFVLAAGAVSSPWLLYRSGFRRHLPVGRGMSFNMGSPVTAEFDDKMDAYAGLQISHYGLPLRERGFVIETWWNPPVAQAVNMPGWFERHFDNMSRYDRLMAVGVLVGTEPTARVRPALAGGPDVVYTPSAEDLYKLADGLALVSEILFEAGARRLLLNTWGYDELTHPNQIPDIYRITSDPSYITLGTGHPQGGSPMSRDPARGVVGEDFRVHGYDNLWLCDASVFPTSVTVNPQLTVMSLAHRAAESIGERLETTST